MSRNAKGGRRTHHLSSNAVPTSRHSSIELRDVATDYPSAALNPVSLDAISCDRFGRGRKQQSSSPPIAPSAAPHVYSFTSSRSRAQDRQALLALFKAVIGAACRVLPARVPSAPRTADAANALATHETANGTGFAIGRWSLLPLHRGRLCHPHLSRVHAVVILVRGVTKTRMREALSCYTAARRRLLLVRASDEANPAPYAPAGSAAVVTSHATKARKRGRQQDGRDDAAWLQLERVDGAYAVGSCGHATTLDAAPDAISDLAYFATRRCGRDSSSSSSVDSIDGDSAIEKPPCIAMAALHRRPPTGATVGGVPVMVVFGRNPVYVNGHRCPVGVPLPLELSDEISLLEPHRPTAATSCDEVLGRSSLCTCVDRTEQADGGCCPLSHASCRGAAMPVFRIVMRSPSPELSTAL